MVLGIDPFRRLGKDNPIMHSVRMGHAVGDGVEASRNRG